MIARLARLLASPRAWLIFGMLLSRATGFLTALMLARTAGASAVGLYSTVMNTAAPLVSPLSHTMINNNTLMASEQREMGLRGLWRAQLIVTLCTLVLGLPLFAWLLGRAVGPDTLSASQWAWALVGASAVVLGQLGSPLVAALLHGEGRFRAAGQWAALTGLLGLLTVVPVVWAFGLPGALGLAAVTAVMAWSLLSNDLLRRHPPRDPHTDRVPFGPILARLRVASPAMAGLVLNGAVNWLCTIFLMHAHWGSEGVGVLGIGLQWSTLMLIPATAWGGMTLQLIGEAHRNSDRAALAATLRGQLLRNAGITALGALVVAAAGTWLERLYGLHDSGLPLVLAGFAIAAVLSSVNNVFERLWWAAGRQRIWFAWSCGGLALQLAATSLLLPHHLAFACVGVLCSALALTACSLIALPRYMERLGRASQ